MKTKDVRKQIRNVIQEELEVLLKEELLKGILDQLKSHIDLRLDYIYASTKEAITKLEEQNKSIQSVLISQSIERRQKD